MTNKLVIIRSLKVPKIKKILLYEMKFLVPNYSCLQNPWLGGYGPQILVLPVPCPQLKLLDPPPSRTKFLGTPLHWHNPNTSTSHFRHCTQRQHVRQDAPHRMPTPANWTNIKTESLWMLEIGNIVFSHRRVLVMLKQILNRVQGYGLDVAGSGKRPEMASVESYRPLPSRTNMKLTVTSSFLTHWGRVTQICVFTLQLCKTDDANLCF
jgi:hypothetical protein